VETGLSESPRHTVRGAGPGSGGVTTTGTKTANYTAAVNQLVPVDVSGGVVTITLPSAAAAGADTPVYAGLVQFGTTPSSLRGFSGSAQIGPAMTPKWMATSSGGVNKPAALASVVVLNDAASAPFVRLSSVYN
jgi:hypothetical protein